MNKQEWIHGIYQKDTVEPPEPIKGERMYTLYIRDFDKMPTVDFQTLVQVDQAIRSLLN